MTEEEPKSLKSALTAYLQTELHVEELTFMLPAHPCLSGFCQPAVSLREIVSHRLMNLNT